MAQLFYLPFNPVFNSRGLPTGAAQAYFFYTGTTDLAPIYSDGALTTRAPNPATADALGQLPKLYLDDSITYRLRVVDKNQQQLGEDYDPYVPGKENAGPAGPANSTFTTRAALKAAPAGNGSYIFAPVGGADSGLAAGTFLYQTANAPYTDDNTNIIALDAIPLTTGALVRQGASGIAFTAPGAGAAPLDAQTKLRQTVAVTDYTGTPNQQWAAALAAVAPKGEIILPQGVTMTYDVSAGFSGALNINKPVTVRILGRLQTNGHGPRSYPFRVTSPDVTFIVDGVLAGDGSVDGTNDGDITTHPGLVYVDTGADRFRLSGAGTIDTPPKVAIVLADNSGAVIEGVTAIGGPQTYGGTAYFFAIATGGGNHKFTNLKAPSVPGSGAAVNAKFVNFIFFGGSFGDPVNCVVSNCSPIVVWEKLVYAHGSGHMVQGCKGAGDKTDWIRLWGDNNTAYACEVTGGNGLVTILDGKGCVVRSCKGFLLQQTGITVARNSTSYTGGFSGTIIDSNALYGDPTSSGLQDGIGMALDGANSMDIQATSNTVSGFAPSSSGRAQINIAMASPYAITDSLIDGNVCTDTPGNAIVVNRVISSAIQNNKARNVGGAFLSEVGGAFNRWLNNTGTTITNKGIQGFSAASEKTGNRFTNGALTGSATLASGTITVSNTEVLDGDEILLSVAASGGTPGFLSYSVVAGTSFTIVSSSGSDASVIRWRINH